MRWAGRKGFRWSASFRASQTERDYAIVFSLDSHARHIISHGPCACGIGPLPHNVEDPIDLDVEVCTRACSAALHAGEVDLVGDAEQVMRTGCHGHLGVANVLLCHGGSELVDDLLVVLARFQTARDQHEGLDEVIEVAIGEALPQFPGIVYRQRYLIAPRESDGGCRLYSAFEVNMQFGLGSSLEILFKWHYFLLMIL
jgi:hypothetical protein